ncbi:LCP family protein [Curtobacterium sp. MCJR17_043]|nr:LCP family protein [Curtobacterium sp. MCJR17_043]WIB36226.1 LCP family protein [Curtobacterium sp. MCJR17_043]
MTGRRAAARSIRHRPLLVALLATVGSLTAIATVLAVVASVFIGGLAERYDAGRTVLDDPFPSGGRPHDDGDALDVLLIGSDARERLDPQHDGVGGGRSDTLMLAHVSADRRHVSLMSILRDSWVEVPGHGRAKINAAYSWGGVPLTVQTVEQLLGVRIDHVAEIDFAGFVGMTDALGGVTVQSPRDLRRPRTPLRPGTERARRRRGAHVRAGALRLPGRRPHPGPQPAGVHARAPRAGPVGGHPDRSRGRAAVRELDERVPLRRPRSHLPHPGRPRLVPPPDPAARPRDVHAPDRRGWHQPGRPELRRGRPCRTDQPHHRPAVRRRRGGGSRGTRQGGPRPPAEATRPSGDSGPGTTKRPTTEVVGRFRSAA